MFQHLKIKTFVFIVVGFCSTTICCSEKIYPETAEISFIQSPHLGVVELSSIGYGSTLSKAELNTYVTAFNNLLFKGLPAFDALRHPFVDNEKKSRIDNPMFYRKFFDERGYLRFVSNQSATSNLGKSSDDKTQIRVKKNISINYESLRRYLEEQGIIRKFGY